MSNVEEEEREECLSPADVDIVRPLLNEFKSAKRSARKHVVRKCLTAVMAARDIDHLRPLDQGKMIARVKEVRAKCCRLGSLSTDLMPVNSKLKPGSTIMDVDASQRISSNMYGAGIFDRWWVCSIMKRLNGFVGAIPKRFPGIRNT
jgi:hypothetical protein